MSPFEALYGQSCNTHISWSDLVNGVLIGTNMTIDMEQEIHLIKRNLKAAQDRKKRYADRNKLLRSFRLGIMCICTSSPKRDPRGLNNVPSWQ